jgi:hypothetical protein
MAYTNGRHKEMRKMLSVVFAVLTKTDADLLFISLRMVRNELEHVGDNKSIRMCNIQ